MVTRWLCKHISFIHLNQFLFISLNRLKFRLTTCLQRYCLFKAFYMKHTTGCMSLTSKGHKNEIVKSLSGGHRGYKVLVGI